MQHPAVHAVRRGRQPDDLHVRVGYTKAVKELLVHRIDLARYQMRLIHNYEIDLLEQVGLSVYGLDAAEHNGWCVLALTDTSRVDTGVGLRPLAHHLGVVLGYQLHNVSDNHDLHLAVFGNGLTAYLGQHKTLARAGG